MNDTNCFEMEPKWFDRGFKEAIHILVTHPSLNKDGGRYNLSSVWTQGPCPRTSCNSYLRLSIISAVSSIVFTTLKSVSLTWHNIQ